MKNILLVTGGCGYIGSHTVVDALENTGYEVVSIDNHLNSSEQVAQAIRTLTQKPFQNYNVDLCDKLALEEVLQELSQKGKIIGVIHFAALKSVPDSVADPIFYYHNNLNSLLNLLELSKKYEIKNFIFSSSCSVYGNTQELPVSEQTAFGKAESPYAYSKQVGERMIEDFAKTSPNQKFVLLRYFNPVGAHMSAQIGEDPINPPTSLVPIITQTAIGLRKEMFVHGFDYPTRDGSCIRDYIHVSDIAAAHRLAVDFLLQNADAAQVDIFNLGTGNGVTVLEAIYAFEKASGQQLNYKLGARREGDVVEIYADNQKAQDLLNWIPQYGIEDMMASAWNWQQQVAKSHI